MDKDVGVLRTHKEPSDVAEGPGTKCSHTSGSWHYRPSGDGFVIRSKGAQGPIAGVNGSRPIAEATANARLIAAAPDLLKAIDNACARLQSFLDTFGDVGDCVTQADLDDWQALAALAKDQPGDTVSADGTSSLYDSSLNKSNPAASGGAE